MKLYGIIVTILFSSCINHSEYQITHLIKKWNNKEIIFPDNPFFLERGKDTVDFHLSNAEYKIVSYVDSFECFSCKLQLNKWQEFIDTIDSLGIKNVLFGFFLQAKPSIELQEIIQKNNFNYPICFDEKGEFNNLNQFPTLEGFQTFLLDKNNRVITIGNPIHLLAIKELYVKVISGKRGKQELEQTRTEAEISASVIDFGTFHWEEHKDTTVTLVNKGKKPLAIHDIATSCGCTVADYDKRPAMPGKSLEVKISFKADHPGYFSKTIGIYCNTPQSLFKVRVRGYAEKEK